MAAGFCVFNDCGILIEHLKQAHGLLCIAYVDIDAHHGDGVFYAFESDSGVYIADIHEDGDFLYPGSGFPGETGRGEATGNHLNLPVPPGADDAVFMAAWGKVEAHMRAAKPEFIILHCGADEYCDGRLLGLGGGGYNRRNLAVAWCAVVDALL